MPNRTRSQLLIPISGSGPGKILLSLSREQKDVLYIPQLSSVCCRTYLICSLSLAGKSFHKKVFADKSLHFLGKKYPNDPMFFLMCMSQFRTADTQEDKSSSQQKSCVASLSLSLCMYFRVTGVSMLQGMQRTHS